MKVVRTFHPIGQGAFYSERFYDGSDCQFIVVYDCGVQSVKNNHKNVVRQSFAKDDVIDYLFISHLDEDHISLVTTLRDSVRFIRTVVLPYISPKNVRINKILSQSLGLTEVYDFWSMVDDAFEGNLNDDISFRFVYPDDVYIEHSINRNRHTLYSGEHLSLSCSDWIFIPYNKHIERKKELEDKLNDLVHNGDFQKALKQIGLTIDTIEALEYMINNDSFADLIAYPIIKKYLRKAYKEITGSINQNSLLVYSGPPSYDTQLDRLYRLSSCFCGYECSVYCRQKSVACLYTGDGDLDMQGYINDLKELWKNVGTIQLPHHGSYGSFDYRNNKSYFDEPRFFPVSCGENNKYGHPSSKVIAFLISKGSLPIIVTEKASTMFCQVIWGK